LKGGEEMTNFIKTVTGQGNAASLGCCGSISKEDTKKEAQTDSCCGTSEESNDTCCGTTESTNDSCCG
jgi:hypothetical protein